MPLLEIDLKKENGLPKSGRVWKKTQKVRTSQALDVPQVFKGFKRMREKREEFKRVKELENKMKLDAVANREEMKRRRKQKRLAKEENRKKSEVYQIVRHVSQPPSPLTIYSFISPFSL